MFDPVVGWIARSGLALLFAVALAHKVRDLPAFGRVVAGHRLVPERLVPVAGALVVAAEAAVLAMLLLPSAEHTAGAAAGALLLVYTLAIAVNLARGRRDIDCGCLGPGHRQPLSGWLVARNAVLLAGAAALALPAAARPLLWVDVVSIAAATGMLALLWSAANLLGNGLGPARPEAGRLGRSS